MALESYNTSAKTPVGAVNEVFLEALPDSLEVPWSTYIVQPNDRLLEVTGTQTGDVTITLSTAFIAQKRTVIEIHNAGAVGKVSIQTQGSEKISGFDDYELLNEYNVVRLRMMGTYAIEIGSVS